MESMDPKKFQEELDKQQRKVSVGLSLNEHFFTEFKRICDQKKWKYGETLDKMVKDFVETFNPKFK